MLWLKKRGAAHSVAFHNVHDAAILWFSEEPHQVDATVVRQGAVTQMSTTDEASVARARAVAEQAPPWVPVVSDEKWEKYVNVDRVTDVVLQDDPPPGATRGVRKLVLSITYVAPANPYQPQTYVCGEVHEPNMIEHVLARFGHKLEFEDD